MPENGLPAVRNDWFYGLPAGFLAGWNDTPRLGRKRLLARRGLCVNAPIIVAVRQYRGCWLQLPATFGHIRVPLQVAAYDVKRNV
jgi:hypothetical protein